MNRKNIARWIAFAALLMPGLAMANMTPYGATAWDVYAFGNGSVLANILTGASVMLQPGGAYYEFIVFTALTGIIVLAFIASHSAGGARKMIASFIVLAAILSVGIRTTGDVVIQDEVNGTTNTVRNVPSLLFLPVAVVTTVGHNLTHTLETYYSIPSDLNLQTGGFNIANSLIQASTKITVTDPLFRATMEQFSENCIIPGIASGRVSAYDLIHATNLFGTGSPLANVPQSPLTNVFTDQNPAGVLVACGPGGAQPGTSAANTTPAVTATNAYDYISSYLGSIGSNYTSAGAYTNTPIFGFMTAASLANAQTQLSGGVMTSNGAASIEQAAAINVMNPSLNAAAVASGNSQMVTAMSLAQGETTQKTGWVTAGLMFQNLSGYIYAVLQAFMIAISPLVVAALFFPGAGLGIAKNYLQVTIWLALWEPMLSIVNYLVTLFSAGPFGSSLGQYAGYTLMNMPAVSEQTANMTAAAGFLAASVPIISWGLVKGGMAFTEFISKGMGASLAAAAAQEAATGNISLNNQSYNNRTLDKWAMDAVTTVGSAGAIVNQAALDATTNRHTANFNELVGGVGVTLTGSQVLSTISSLGMSKVNSNLTSASRDFSQALTDTQNLVNQYGTSSGSSVSGGSTTNSGTAWAASSKAGENYATDAIDKLSNTTNDSAQYEMLGSIAADPSMFGSALSKKVAALRDEYHAGKITRDDFDKGYKDAMKGVRDIATVKGAPVVLNALLESLNSNGKVSVGGGGSKDAKSEVANAATRKEAIENAASLEGKAAILKTIQDSYSAGTNTSENHSNAVGYAINKSRKSLEALTEQLSKTESVIASVTSTSTTVAPVVKSAAEAESAAGVGQQAAVEANNANSGTPGYDAANVGLNQAYTQGRNGAVERLATDPQNPGLYNPNAYGEISGVNQNGLGNSASAAADGFGNTQNHVANQIGQTGKFIGQGRASVNQDIKSANEKFESDMNKAMIRVLGASILTAVGPLLPGTNISKTVAKDAEAAAAAAGEAAAAKGLTAEAVTRAAGRAAAGVILAGTADAALAGYGAYELGNMIGTQIYNQIADSSFADGLGSAEARVLAFFGNTEAQSALALANGQTPAYAADGSISVQRSAAYARQAVSYFQSQGWSEDAAKAITTNLYAESLLDPTAHNASGATGVAQWLSRDRQQGLAAYAMSHPATGEAIDPMKASTIAQGLSPAQLRQYIATTSLDQQLGFVNQELQSGRYANVASVLRDPNASIADKVSAVSKGYEVPGSTPEQQENFAQNRAAMIDDLNNLLRRG